MARYDRLFLVPYLQDTCSLHYAKLKLTKLIEDCDNEVQKIMQKARNNVPKPQYEVEINKATPWKIGCGLLLAVVGAIMGLIMILDLIIYGEIGGVLGGVAIAAIGVYVCVRAVSSHKAVISQIQNRNQLLKKQYDEDIKRAISGADSEIAKVTARKNYYISQRDMIACLLEDIYGVNVIPRWYRDMYAAVYLYDWFSNSLADDLDMALNTFVLEKIKDRLDAVIRNQKEELINQRIIIANQHKAMEQAERHHAALMSKLDEMQACAEERNIYLSMIERNTTVDSFFSMATYLKS